MFFWNESRIENFFWPKDTPRVFCINESGWSQLLAGLVGSLRGEIIWEGPKEPDTWIGLNRPYWAQIKEVRTQSL